MNCADVRRRLLTADLAVLRGESEPSVAEHLAACSACASVAALIVNQTSRLGATLAVCHREPVRRSLASTSTRVTIPIATAAGIALIAFLAHREMTTVQSRVPSNGLTTVNAPASQARPKSTTGRDPARLDRRATPAITSVQRTAEPAVATPLAQIAMPSADSVETDYAAADGSLSQVRVIVRGRQGATVMKTSNPNITVVLLTRGGSL